MKLSNLFNFKYFLKMKFRRALINFICRLHFVSEKKDDMDISNIGEIWLFTWLLYKNNKIS